MKPRLIVNPRSCGGRTGKTFASMQRPIERALGPVDVVFTEHRGHASMLAEQAANDGCELVVAVGGDGTVHEVVNGLIRAKQRTRLGIIGQGTGGDLCRSLGIEHRLDRYLEAITRGSERTIDVGKFSAGGVSDHFFVNILSVGMSGLVDRHVARIGRVLSGTAAYFGASARALLDAELGRVRIAATHHGTTTEHEVQSFMIALCNGKYFGSGMHVAPMASLDDGAFDLVALGAQKKTELLFTSKSIYEGTHLRHPHALVLRGERFELQLMSRDISSRFLLDVDGEEMGELPLVVEVLPKALTIRG